MVSLKTIFESERYDFLMRIKLEDTEKDEAARDDEKEPEPYDWELGSTDMSVVQMVSAD